MAHQVFISYGHEDKLVADATCARLEARGIRCWIAPRDVLPGQAYGEAISAAIRGCRALVLVFSSHANLSDHVSKEVERAVSNAIPVVPLRIENVTPTGALDYFIGSVHWLDALTPPMEQHLERLADSVERLIGEPHPTKVPRPVPAPVPSKPLGMYAAAGVVALLLLLLLFRSFSGESATNSAAVAPNVAPIASPSTPVSNSPRDPSSGQAGITGCWSWFNGGILRMEQDGRVTGTPFDAHWREAGGNRYTLHWPAIQDSVMLAAGGRSLSGTNNFGIPVSAQRISSGPRGPQSLAGVWQWNAGAVTAGDDGSIAAGPFHGRWAATAGGFTVTWNDPPVDQLTLSADGQQVSGQNQFGVKVSGTRAPCSN
jgi:hypothetical protein